MCEPVSITMGAIALAGGVAKGVADKQAADANAAAMKRNATQAEQAASVALQQGESDASRVQMQGEAIKGQQVAGYAGQGVDVASGSAAQTVLDTAAITGLDREVARNNAQREAWGLQAQGTNLRNAAKDATAAGNMALATGLIGGAGGAASAGLSGLSATGYFKKGGPKPPGEVSV
jgi:hypothetical protein